MYCYVISGLSVSCDIELPGLIALQDPPTVPDVVIHGGPVPQVLDAASASGPNWQMTDRAVLIAVPGVVRMLIREGAEIVFEVDAASTSADAAVFLSGTGMGIVLHQRKAIVLHASAVDVNGGAVLFCGPSGAGKSTMAAALVDAGYPLVADDVCAVSIDENGRPWVEPDGRQMKLWQHSIDRLALADSRAAPVRAALQKFYVEPRRAALVRLPLVAIYMLREAREPHAPGIERPNIVDSALLVRQNAYRPTFVKRMAQQQLYFIAAATICHQASVFRLTRALDFTSLPHVVGSLEQHWGRNGFLGA